MALSPERKKTLQEKEEIKNRLRRPAKVSTIQSVWHDGMEIDPIFRQVARYVIKNGSFTVSNIIAHFSVDVDRAKTIIQELLDYHVAFYHEGKYLACMPLSILETYLTKYVLVEKKIPEKAAIKQPEKKSLPKNEPVYRGSERKSHSSDDEYVQAMIQHYSGSTRGRLVTTKTEQDVKKNSVVEQSVQTDRKSEEKSTLYQQNIYSRRAPAQIQRLGVYYTGSTKDLAYTSSELTGAIQFYLWFQAQPVVDAISAVLNEDLNAFERIKTTYMMSDDRFFEFVNMLQDINLIGVYVPGKYIVCATNKELCGKWLDDLRKAYRRKDYQNRPVMEMDEYFIESYCSVQMQSESKFAEKPSALIDASFHKVAAENRRRRITGSPLYTKYLDDFIDLRTVDWHVIYDSKYLRVAFMWYFSHEDDQLMADAIKAVINENLEEFESLKNKYRYDDVRFLDLVDSLKEVGIIAVYTPGKELISATDTFWCNKWLIQMMRSYLAGEDKPPVAKAAKYIDGYGFAKGKSAAVPQVLKHNECVKCGAVIPYGQTLCEECMAKENAVAEMEPPHNSVSTEPEMHECPGCGTMIPIDKEMCDECAQEAQEEDEYSLDLSFLYEDESLK